MEISKNIFAYMGNKSTIAQWCIDNFPPQFDRYVEIFGGTGAVLLEKPKSEVELYNDFNGHLPNMFECIRTMKDEFVEKINELIISEDLFNHYWAKMENMNTPVERDGDKLIVNLDRAVMYFYIMSFTHKGKYTGGFSVIPDKSYTEKLQEKINTINWIHQRIKNVIISNKSYEKLVTANNKEGVLLYLDPPYNKTESYYEKLAGTFSQAEHIKLRDLLRKHKGYFLLSYEADPFIADLYSEFYILGKEKYRPGKGEEVEEILVCNYKPQANLFSQDLLRNTITQFEKKIEFDF